MMFSDKPEVKMSGTTAKSKSTKVSTDVELLHKFLRFKCQSLH